MFRIIGYVDPGTGATLMQLVLAGTVGIGAIIKLKWHSIRSLFGRSEGDRAKGPDARFSEVAADHEEHTS